MANIKISQMNETNSLNDNDLLTVVQAGKNKKIKILNTNEISISSIQPTANEKVWFKKGKNLLDKNNAQTTVGYFNSTGKIENGGNSTIILNYIKIKPNETYTVSCLSQIEKICFYDANGVFIKQAYTQNVTEYTFTENAYYIRLQLATSVNILDSIQIENGTMATSYEAYIEPAILVKNNAGVYEEYMNKNNLIDYSTAEQKIGTWIDGKTLYRKVIKGKTATDNDSTYINVGNIKIHMINGNVIRRDGYKFFIPFNENGQSYIVVFQIPDARLRIIAKNSSNDFRGSEYNLVIEYTKTTD